MAESIIYIIDIIILAFLGVQLVSVILFLITEWAMVDYYQFGTFENPTNNFQKFINFGMAFFMGSGYFLYRRFKKYNWITRKFFMLISLVVHGILCMFIYFIIMKPLEWILL